MAHVWHSAPSMTRSVAACTSAGIVFEPYEAVAIVQQLISSFREPQNSDEVRGPFGPPTVENVLLDEDGSVSCPACGVTPTVSEVGMFLDQLLAAGSPRIPGGLRYTVARALLNVDVPPFDSLDALSRDLSRHERGGRADVVRQALARLHRPHLIAAMPPVERRRSHASATTLRRELREADARLYLQRAEPIARPTVIDLVAAPPAPPRGRPLTATAACLAAGFSLIAAGEFMYSRPAPTSPPQPAAVVAETAPPELRPVPPPIRPAMAPESQRDRAIASPQPPPGIIAVRNVSSTPGRGSRADGPRSATNRTSRPAPASARRRPAPRPAQRGVLDRLRLGWLKNAFTGHSSL